MTLLQNKQYLNNNFKFGCKLIGYDFLPISPKDNPDMSFRKLLVTDVYSVNKTPVHCVIILGQLC